MFLFINQSTGNIETKYSLNTIQIEIPIPIKILNKIEKDTKPYIKDGEMIYLDSENKETNKSFEILRKLKPFDFNECSMIVGRAEDNDEDLNYVKIKENTAQLECIYYHEIIELNEDNAVNFKLDDILSVYYSTMLRQNDFEIVFFDMLEDIFPTYSSFQSCNKYKTVLIPGDRISLGFVAALGKVTDAEFKVYGINPNMKLFINHIECNLNDDIIKISGDFDNVFIEIENSTNDIQELNMPFILYRNGGNVIEDDKTKKK